MDLFKPTITGMIASDLFLSDDTTELLTKLVRDNANKVFDCDHASQGKISAIKEFRRATGFGLKDAKEAVEAIMIMAQNTDIPLQNANRIIDLQQKEIDALRVRVDTLHQRLNSIIEMSDADTLRAIVRDLI
jgi:DNA-binding transcriptional MerR regulator